MVVEADGPAGFFETMATACGSEIPSTTSLMLKADWMRLKGCSRTTICVEQAGAGQFAGRNVAGMGSAAHDVRAFHQHAPSSRFCEARAAASGGRELATRTPCSTASSTCSAVASSWLASTMPRAPVDCGDRGAVRRAECV